MPATIDIDIRCASDVLASQGVATTLQGIWNPNNAERGAAWDTLVELVTRVSVVPLKEEEGRLDAGLASLAAIFEAVRRTLQRHGPDVADERQGELSFAVIASHLVNRVLRPVTAWWHPRVDNLNEDESKELREVLRELALLLTEYAKVLAQACGAQEFARYLIEDGVHYDRPAGDSSRSRKQ